MFEAAPLMHFSLDTRQVAIRTVYISCCDSHSSLIHVAVSITAHSDRVFILQQSNECNNTQQGVGGGH